MNPIFKMSGLGMILFLSSAAVVSASVDSVSRFFPQSSEWSVLDLKAVAPSDSQWIEPVQIPELRGLVQSGRLSRYEMRFAPSIHRYCREVKSHYARTKPGFARVRVVSFPKSEFKSACRVLSQSGAKNIEQFIFLADSSRYLMVNWEYPLLSPRRSEIGRVLWMKTSQLRMGKR